MPKGPAAAGAEGAPNGIVVRASAACTAAAARAGIPRPRSEEHTSELQSHSDLVSRLLLEKKRPGPERTRALNAVAPIASKETVATARPRPTKPSERPALREDVT